MIMAAAAFKPIRRCLQNFGLKRALIHSSRPVVPLTKKHAEFLSLVKQAGDGKISLEADEVRKVLILRISNPSKRNAIDGTMLNHIAEIVDQITLSLDIQSKYIGLVICGDKSSFCSGFDLNVARDYVNTPEKGVQMSLFMTDCLNRIRMSPLVSVAVITGPALGGGAELATCTDFRIINTAAYICFVHAKIGAAPGWGGVHRLVSLIGRTRAIDLLGTSKKITADHAVDYKLAERCFDDNRECSEIGIEYLLPFLQQPFPESVQSIKYAVAAASDYSVDVANEVATTEFSKRWGSPSNSQIIKERLAKSK